MPKKPTCLTCGGEIRDGQPKKEVTGRRGKQYMHANYKDCQAELAKTSGRAESLRSARVRARRGVAPKRSTAWPDKK